MPNYHILFIDDDETGRALSVYNLQQAGYGVDDAVDGKHGLAEFDEEKHDLVITDLRMPGLGGMEILKQLSRRAPEVPILVITAHGNVETAVEAMKAGAYDFLEKPFSRDELLLLVKRALERVALKRENRRLRLQAAGIEREIIGVSAPMQAVLRTADRIARGDVSVLITGESGTGKELIARRLHARSRRAERPFVAINCAAMPSELLESELFGHEKGAYTGADRKRQGRFRAAEGGTIFLDEIGEMAPGLQAKLLRVLQERVIDVVGLDAPIAVDVRVIAATNRDLLKQIEGNRFRQDLYYRLNTIEIRLPALAERPEDIPPLVDHFLKRASAEQGRSLVAPKAVLDALVARAWPGNIRELENACERMALLCDVDELQLEDLPPPPSPEKSTEADTEISLDRWPALPADGLSLIDLERQVIERALKLKQGNVTQTAAYLRVPRHFLVYRIAKYGLDREG